MFWRVFEEESRRRRPTPLLLFAMMFWIVLPDKKRRRSTVLGVGKSGDVLDCVVCPKNVEYRVGVVVGLDILDGVV